MLFPGILGLLILYFFLQQDSEPELLESISTIPIQQIDQNTSVPEEEPIHVQTIMIDIKGAVKYPGVYELNADGRIIDAIRLAGGYTADAETQIINHAQKLQDEMVIYIPKKGEEMATPMNAIGQTINVTSNTTNNSNGKVDINSADASQLTTLPGIGPSKAQAIITYREENGTFNTIEEVKNVSGIGDKTFEKLKEYIIVK